MTTLIAINDLPTTEQRLRMEIWAEMLRRTATPDEALAKAKDAVDWIVNGDAKPVVVEATQEPEPPAPIALLGVSEPPPTEAPTTEPPVVSTEPPAAAVSEWWTEARKEKLRNLCLEGLSAGQIAVKMSRKWALLQTEISALGFEAIWMQAREARERPSETAPASTEMPIVAAPTPVRAVPFQRHKKPRVDWTPERIAELRRECQAGKSTKDIATAMQIRESAVSAGIYRFRLQQEWLAARLAAGEHPLAQGRTLTEADAEAPEEISPESLPAKAPEPKEAPEEIRHRQPKLPPETTLPPLSEPRETEPAPTKPLPAPADTVKEIPLPPAPPVRPTLADRKRPESALIEEHLVKHGVTRAIDFGPDQPMVDYLKSRMLLVCRAPKPPRGPWLWLVSGAAMTTSDMWNRGNKLRKAAGLEPLKRAAPIVSDEVAA